ncbi:MAG: TrbI/VirB10 family protein [Erythrobacter sp.]
MTEAQAHEYEYNDPRPVVATGSSGNWGIWVFIVILLIGGVVIFNALSSSREASQVPSVLDPRITDGTRISAPSPVGVPARFLDQQNSAVIETTSAGVDPIQAPVRAPLPPVILPQIPTFSPAPIPTFSPAPLPPQVVFEGATNQPASPVAAVGADSGERVTADRFVNPSLTIPQGTVIPAVLETAIDSTRPGGVRALVQRNVSSFDGSRVLIPRGSRLYGEYEANLQQGQNRAMVQWTRLIRPDGVTIALNSPSSDPLGRAGIRGKVDGKFLQRFGGALLQSVLDIGVGLAVNEATDGVIVALPGSTQNVQVTQPEQIQPTLKVKHGTSVSVFVSRDLDFSTEEP